MSEPLDHSKEITQVNPGPKPLWNAGIREFFMLFLAVFCGFLAENYREKLADNEAEKQSMELLAKSLKSDTLELSKTIRMYNERGLFVDSFIHLKDSDFSLSENRRLFFKYTIMGMLNSRFFNINQSGFEQLKYSGTIRQVSNQEILQRLGVYYNAYQTEILAEEND
ncbi:MAG TPA: hypothetical protein PK509_07010 [Catalimonadaceae bacterium]|nr:hypothetical protein [Catalimonadaceae bacterium]